MQRTSSDHQRIAHCIRLPDSCGKVEASSEDFRVFLCHLYSADHYRCVPFTVGLHVDLDAQPPPIASLDAPVFDCREDLDSFTASDFEDEQQPPALYEAVVSLSHYFHCHRVLSRVDDNFLLFCDWVDAPDRGELVWPTLWTLFLLALKFDLRAAKKVCIPRLAACCVGGHSHKDEWDSVRAQLDKDTLYELMQRHSLLPAGPNLSLTEH